MEHTPNLHPLDIHPPSPIEVSKGGNLCITITLHRSPKGTNLSIQTNEAVEDFMRELSKGEVVRVDSVGRYWNPIKDGPPLSAYTLLTPLSPIHLDDGTLASFDRIGGPLMIDPQVLNLSFLRLCGACDGLTFSVRGVHTFDALRKVRDRIAYGVRQFYIEYIRPIDLTVMVHTQDLRK